MGGLKPRAGSALAKCVPRRGGAALWVGAIGSAPAAGAITTEWHKP